MAALHVKGQILHNIFDDEIYREGMRTLLLEAAYEYEIPVGEIGFDNNHVHFMADICLYSRDETAKLLKGYTAKKFFEFFPELKRPKYEGGKFWGSGLWNPSYYMGSPKNFENTIIYIRKQKYGERKGQQTLLRAMPPKPKMPPISDWGCLQVFILLFYQFHQSL